MDEIVVLPETTNEYWSFVEYLHKVTGNLLKDKANLKDPNEKEMRLIFNIKSLTEIQDEDNN